MSIKLTDNIMGRPRTPGGQSDGTETVTQRFGNQQEQQANLPSVNEAWGGVANRAAGVEGQAFAKAVETIGQSATNTLTYFDNLRTAEETSNANRMFLDLDKTEADVRTKLDADPEYGKKTTAEQQEIYETERNIAFDDTRQKYGFAQKQVIRQVDDKLESTKAQYSSRYLENVVKPRVVQNAKINDTESDDIVIGKVATEPIATNVADAAKNITDRYDSPQAYAVYGAQGAWAMKAAALKKLGDTVMTSFVEGLEKSPISTLPDGILITEENLKSGDVSQIVGDEKGKFREQINQLPISDQEKLVRIQKGEKTIDQYTVASIKSHNNKVKQAHVERMEKVQDMVDTLQVQLSIGARNGRVSEKQAYAEFAKVIENPSIKDDPQAVKKAYMAYDRVMSEITGFQREQRRLSSENKTRETIAQYRMENGVQISGSQADSVWKKNGNLDSYFKNNSVLTDAHLQEIDRGGAVPTSIVGSIQSDLQNTNPAIQQRGVRNLLAIKTYSAKSQTALYKDLPDDFSGVIQRLENGQEPKEALAFLTRPKNTPDIEKKLASEAGSKNNISLKEDTMKKAGLDPTKMSGGMNQEADSLWSEAYKRANGDTKLAADLFQQNLSKNRNWGKSEFSKQIEKYPLTQFTGSKDVATVLINDAFPETKGTDIIPVFNGLKTINGEQTPTYDIYVKDSETKLLASITSPTKQFYATKTDVANVITKQKQAEADKIKEKQDRMDNSRWNGGSAKF